MICRRYTSLAAGILLLAIPALGTDTSGSKNDAQGQTKMTSQTRILVIRSLQAEHVFAKTMFPMGTKGLRVKDGKISPDEAGVQQLIAEEGMAAKPGDKIVISNVFVKDKSITLELNGGARKKGKWYQHLEVGGMGGMTPVARPDPDQLNSHGSMVTLEFDKFVPEMTAEQVRELFSPVLDFNSLSPAEAYAKTLPPKVREAIQKHQVLVGMDRQMVISSKGRAPKKVRDKDDKGQDYEEWIYGAPPEQVDFVRFQGDQVVRLETMTVDGKKIVKTERDVVFGPPGTEVAKKAEQPKPDFVPSLRRPGEANDGQSVQRDSGRAPRLEDKNMPINGSPPPNPDGSAPSLDPLGIPGTSPGSGAPPH